jgi:outer membrane lipoprotein-sorting protein
MICRILFFAFLASCFFAAPSQAQKDPKAKVVLDAMSQKFQSMKGFTASFEYTFQDEAGTGDRQSGEVAVLGDKYRLKLPDQEIYNDGKTVWTFIQTGGYKEVTINDAAGMEDELTPSNIYTLYQSGFNYKLLADKTYQGKPISTVELTALKPNAPFKQVRLLIEKATQQLLGWEMLDGQGGIFTYSFKNLKAAPSLPLSYFTFDLKKYPGIEVIDLR